MTVYANKPAFNVREKLKELEKPSGIAGEAMLRAETVAEQQALIGVGRRNLLINGGFDVWQRGTSFTPTGANPYTADRWLVYQSNNSNVTVTKRTESTYSSVPFTNYIRLDDTIDADTSWIELNQYVEDYSHLINNTVTVSFWAKASYDIQDGYIYTNAGTTSGAYAITTSWTKYQVTLDLKAGTVASDGYLRLLLGTQTMVAADSYIDYAQVQLELGKVATPFEHRSYGEELALCQRYYQRIQNGQLTGTRNTGTRLRLSAPLSPEMRDSPAVSRISGTTVSVQGDGVNFTSTQTTAAQGATSGTRFMGFDLDGFTGIVDRTYPGSHSTVDVFECDADLR
jgi:hypothetical protein